MIHHKIKKLRKELGITQETMAEHLCISQNAYSLIEKGTTKIDVDRLLQITQKLNISPSLLLEEENGLPTKINWTAINSKLKVSLALKDQLIQKLLQENFNLQDQLEKMNSAK